MKTSAIHVPDKSQNAWDKVSFTACHLCGLWFEPHPRLRALHVDWVSVHSSWKWKSKPYRDNTMNILSRAGWHRQLNVSISMLQRATINCTQFSLSHSCSGLHAPPRAKPRTFKLKSSIQQQSSILLKTIRAYWSKHWVVNHQKNQQSPANTTQNRFSHGVTTPLLVKYFHHAKFQILLKCFSKEHYSLIRKQIV